MSTVISDVTARHALKVQQKSLATTLFTVATGVLCIRIKIKDS